MKSKILSALLALCASGTALAQTYAAGTYAGTAAGRNGDITVNVTFSEDAITAIDVTAQQETAGIADPALERIPAAIVDSQSLGVDTVSGCTITSAAIIETVANAADPELAAQTDALNGQVSTLEAVLDYNEADFGTFAETLATLKEQIKTYLAGNTTKEFDSVEWHMIQTYLGGKRTDVNGNPIEGDYDLIHTLCANSLDTYHWLGDVVGVELTAALSQTNGIFYHIADQAMIPTLQNKATQEDVDAMAEKGILYKADTLEELAEMIGCPSENLIASVEKYNSYVDAGVDADFGKNVFGTKIETAPFYAVLEKPSVHHTMGGVQINTDAEALDTDGNVISGLYAAGEVTGGIHAGNRLGGNAIADCFVFGRIAGTNAAASK